MRGPSASMCAVSMGGSGHSGAPWSMHGTNQRTFAGSEGNPADQWVVYAFYTSRRRPSRLGNIHRQFCLMNLTSGPQRDACKRDRYVRDAHTSAGQERVAHDTRAMGKHWFKVTGSCPL
jgi:hypothetical protein